VKQIRKASTEYAAPADVCTSYKALYQELGKFERDLHQHVHLENNILFPRAVDLEACGHLTLINCMATLSAADHQLCFPVSALAAAQTMEIIRKREEALSRILMAFVTTGLLFMVSRHILGVWNLLQISGKESVASISPAWLQAHGHAQVFGWVEVHSRHWVLFDSQAARFKEHRNVGGLALLVMWTVGAALRWSANVYSWEWRILLPVLRATGTRGFPHFRPFRVSTSARR